ncbi:MAG: hypothetical protein RLZZ450_3057 [Pseudomonadota bacterium]|jgi:two-component system response regulator HydG
MNSTSTSQNAILVSDRDELRQAFAGKAGLRVLVVGVDSDPACELTEQASDDVVYTHVDLAAEARALLRRRGFDALVIARELADADGLDLLRELRAARPELSTLLVAPACDVATAVSVLRAGASDLVHGERVHEELSVRLRELAEQAKLRSLLKRAGPVASAVRSGALIGESSVIRTTLETLERFAIAQAPVRIRGETGTGKELVARALHERSKRRGRLIVVNCAGVTEAQLENELFGNLRGVLAGPRVRRHGLLQEAAGGTLVLDDVGELPPGLQTKLLRVLSEGRVRALGTDSAVAFDARLISIARDDLEAQVASGAFRQDLYYRLNVLQLDLPPLRARGADVLLLAAHFVALAARRCGRSVAHISPEAARRLLAYGWPGNVRELANVLERAVALTDHDEIHSAHLPDDIRGAQLDEARREACGERELLTLEELSRRHILHVMASVGGSRNRAAVVLNVDRKTLYNKLKSYGWGRND